MSLDTHFAVGLADLLRTFALIAGAVALGGLIVVNLSPRRLLRRLDRPSRRMTLRVAGKGVDREAGSAGPPAAETIGPAIASRPPGESEALAELHGVGGLAARARGSRWRKVAREVAASQLQDLARPDRVIEFDLELGGEVVAATVLTTTGIYVVVVHDRDAHDAGGLEALDQLVRRQSRVLSELARLTGIESELIVYSPYIDAPAKPAYIAGQVVTTVGRPSSLAVMLDRREGPGLTTEALDRFRDAAKPQGRSSSAGNLALGVIGRDSPDLEP